MVHAAQGCRLLLEQLYNLSQKSRLDEHVLFPEQVAAILHVDLDDTTEIVNYLEAAGYVKCGRSFGRPYSWIKLTSNGMQLVVNPAALEQALEDLALPAAPRGGSLYNVSEVLGHAGAEPADLQEILDGMSIPVEIRREIEESLYLVAEALERKEDGPLRELLATLILEGGLETTLVGVKALLAIYGVNV